MLAHTYKTALSILIIFYCFSIIIIAYYYFDLDKTKTIKILTNQTYPNLSQNIENSTSTIQIPLEETRNIVQNEIKETEEIATNTILMNSKNTSSNLIATSSYMLIKSAKYIEIIDSCKNDFEGICVNARSGPGKNFPVVTKLRTGMLLKTDAFGIGEDGTIWYHVIFDEWLRFPERIKGDLFVSVDFIKEHTENSEKITNYKNFNQNSSTTKKILVKLSLQKLYAYENIDGVNKLFLETYVSTGLEDLPTPMGAFKIFYKTPSRYMQGPITGLTDQYYDLPGVPWTMYFNNEGAAIHGAYWHDNFGTQWSHGCINLYPYDAETLYHWASLGTEVVVEK